ncbi:MAG: hypothetical protein OXH76_21765, partial [Boseongicola sp.]|nr:hypothetical protein [Boseongicola sp.]
MKVLQFGRFLLPGAVRRGKRLWRHRSAMAAILAAETVMSGWNRVAGAVMVLPERFELSTSPLPRECS